MPLVGSMAKITATKAAPTVCPSKRAIPSIPLAPPLRSRGAEAMIVLLLGVMNKPKPIPPRNIRQMISMWEGCAGITASRKRATPKITNPIPPSKPALKRSINRPATGAAIIAARGQGVSINPVSTTFKCRMR